MPTLSAEIYLSKPADDTKKDRLGALIITIIKSRSIVKDKKYRRCERVLSVYSIKICIINKQLLH